MQSALQEEINNKDRYEIINGKMYMMAPASPTHEEIVMELSGRLWAFLKGKQCKVYGSSLAVYLSGDANDKDFFMPDITVVCDKSKISARGYEGAPTMIVEILSPSNSSHDRVRKFNKYLQAGVREYWIVDSSGRNVTVHVLKNGEYVSSAYEDTDTVSVSVLEGCKIDLNGVFPEE
jgi:Uma2 family endonuclease